MAVVGPTGCGKSTTLTLVSGLEEPTEGEVLVAGEPVAGVGDKVGFVFQQDATFPGGRSCPMSWRARVFAVFRRRRPSSGPANGWPGSGCRPSRTVIPTSSPAVSASASPSPRPRQRPRDPADGRAVLGARRADQGPDVGKLLELWEGTGASVVFVTHDLEESIALADKVVVMTAGPATVKQVFDIDLPRPRKVESVRLEPRFIEIYREIWESLGEEVRITREGRRECRLTSCPRPSSRRPPPSRPGRDAPTPVLVPPADAG